MSVTEWLLAAAVGGLLGLDAASLPQVMVARPLVAASLGGLLAGNGALGLWAGVVLEILSTRQLPVGGARYPETGPAAFAAGWAYAGAGGGSSELLLATAVGLLAGWLGGWTVQLQRQVNAVLVAPLAARPTPPAVLIRRQLSALALDFGRAAVVTVLWLLMARAVLSRAWAPWPAPSLSALLLALAAAVGVGSALRTLARGSEVWRAFTLTSLVAVLGVWVSS